MFYHWLGRLIFTHRRLALAGLLAVTLATGALLPSIRFDFTPQALFEQHDEVNDFARAIRVDFGDETNTLLLLWRTGEPEGVFSPQTLTDLQQVTAELEAWDESVRVVSLTNLRLPRNERRDGGELELNLGALAAASPVSAAQAEALAAAVRGEPLLEQVTVSRSGAETTLAVELSQEARSINTLVGVLQEAEAMVARWRETLPSRPDLVLTGLPAVRVEIVSALQNEQVRFLPLTALLMALLLGWMFRRASGVVLPIGSILLALVWTAGMLVVVNQPLNIINSVLPTLLMIIGLSDAIHLLSRAAEEASRGLGREDVVVNAVHRMGMACLLTSLTTAIGFGSLLMANAEILQAFGAHTAIGVMLAYIATIVFIPAMLAWMKPPVRSGLHHARPGNIERLMAMISRLVLDSPRAVLVGGLAVGVVAGVVAYRTVLIDTRLLEVFPPGHPVAELTREIEDEFSGVLPLIISVEAQTKGYFEDPEHLEKLATLQRRTAAHDEALVLKTVSVYDLLQVFRAAYLARPELRDRPFETRAQVATVLRLYRQDAASDVNRLLDADNRHALIVVRLRDLGIRRGLETVRAVAEEAERLFGQGAAEGVLEAQTPSADQAVQVRLAGDAYLASVGLLNFIHDLLSSLGLAMLLIFAAMSLLFRSLRLGLIAVIPNVLPLLATAGWMGLRGIELNTTTVIIFSVSLGLAVDDTIHFLTRYQEERTDQTDVATAIHRTFLGAGRAIVITSVVLLVGIMVLLTTEFLPTRYFAELIGCTVTGALLGDLFVLPALLLLFDRRGAAGDGVST